MIAGEVPAPGVGMGNRDVVLRHLHAIVFGAAEPGLSGQMGDYITLQGGLKQEAVDQLIAGLEAQFEHAATLALEAWGPEILEPAGLTSRETLLEALGQLPDRVRDLFDRVRYQILQLEETIRRWSELGRGDRMALNAMDLKRKLLGIRAEKDASREADDRTPGHPLRRFAEFGILPGYEFPSEPCTLRMWNDRNEDDPISVERRFGLAQYQIDARVHARGHRWRVIGLDTASPWNPKTPEPSWVYAVCKQCELRYDAQQQVRCPRCKSDATVGNGFPGHDFGGFLALRDDTPVLEEEDRFAIASLVQIHPQWDGQVKGRYLLSTGWHLQLRLGEEIRWLNEWRQPSESDKKEGRPYLHDQGRGFYLCPSCGKALSMPEENDNRRGRRKAKTNGREYEHAGDCERAGQPPRPLAITTHSAATTLRLVVYLPTEMNDDSYQQWGYSLGYALRIGIRQLYMLDGPEIEFVLEPMWEEKHDNQRHRKGALTFIDPAVGGSGFLERAAEELHLVARRTLDHLDHSGCESACYRCLKSYNNQRHHQYLSWPEVIPELEQLGELAPHLLQPELGDAEDPRPWLEAYAAGVGSPLELKFLRLFEQHGLEVEKQVPVSPNQDEPAISVADFVVKGKQVAVYVDGAAFHRGRRLRRDRIIRQRLREGNMGWMVVEVRAGDLSKGADLVSQIRQSQ